MGNSEYVTANKYPRQGDALGKYVEVCFHYDTSKSAYGICVRDDVEEPGSMIFMLQDGRMITAEECQYTDLNPKYPQYRRSYAEAVRAMSGFILPKFTFGKD